MVSASGACVAVAVSLLNFGFWYHVASSRRCQSPPTIPNQPQDTLIPTTSAPIHLSAVDVNTIDAIRSERFVGYKFLIPQSIVINAHPASPCQSYSSLYVQSRSQCLALVHARKSKSAYNLLRYDSTSTIHMKERKEVFKLPSNMHLPTGFFLKVIYLSLFFYTQYGIHFIL